MRPSVIETLSLAKNRMLFFRRSRASLGRRKTASKASKYEVTTNGTMIESQCETTFSKDATGVETFTWLKSGNEFRLLGYHINSDALIER
jgi:hypothetical protein